MTRAIFEKNNNRKRWPWYFATVVAVSIAAFFLFNKHQENYRYPESGSNVVSFGDSLVAGYGVAAGQDFSSLLSEMIGKPIVNKGKNGDTTEDALKRLKQDVLEQDPRVVILLVGGNDFLQGFPQEKTQDNLNSIIDKIHRQGAAVVLVGIKGGLLQDHFSSMFKKIASSKRTFFVTDILEGLIGDQQYMHDSIHPNAQGHKVMAERIEPQLKKALSGQ